MLCSIATILAVGACRAHPHPRIVHLRDLVEAPSAPSRGIARAIVDDGALPDGLYIPLNRRLGLVQVRSDADWRLLTAATGDLGPPPGFSDGIVVGLVSRAGVPLDGAWPLELESVRVHQGAGLVVASFRGGTYLPDATAYLEMAYVEGLRAVLAVDINGVQFFP